MFPPDDAGGLLSARDRTRFRFWKRSRTPECPTADSFYRGIGERTTGTERRPVWQVCSQTYGAVVRAEQTIRSRAEGLECIEKIQIGFRFDETITLVTD